MLRLGSAPLAFLGSRTYLHSTEVFRFFCDATAALPAEDQPVVIESFKFLRETRRTGSAFILEASETPPRDVPKPVASFAFLTRGQRARRLLLTDDGEPITERHPEAPLRIQPPAMTGDFSGTIECRDIRSAADFFVALIEASKAIHEETLRRRGEDSSVPYRFVACEALSLVGIVPPDGRGRLTFELADLRRVRGHTFTFDAVRLTPGDLPPLRLCIAYEQPAVALARRGPAAEIRS
jgi:hypothetical protein